MDEADCDDDGDEDGINDEDLIGLIDDNNEIEFD